MSGEGGGRRGTGELTAPVRGRSGREEQSVGQLEQGHGVRLIGFCDWGLWIGEAGEINIETGARSGEESRRGEER
jgi:hypothetical protein